MRLLVDAQLPPTLCHWFIHKGIDAEHVRDVLGGQTPDDRIAAYAEQHELILLTKDDDFLLHYPADYSRLVWLRCGNITNRRLLAWLEPRWPMVEARLEHGDKIVEVR